MNALTEKYHIEWVFGDEDIKWIYEAKLGYSCIIRARVVIEASASIVWRYVSDPNHYKDWNEAVWARTDYQQLSPVSTTTITSDLIENAHITENAVDAVASNDGASVASTIGVASGQPILLQINLYPYLCMRVPSWERVNIVDHSMLAISWRKSVDCCLYTDRWQIVEEGLGNNESNSTYCTYYTALIIPGPTGVISRLAFASRILRCFQEFGIALKSACQQN